MASWQNRMIERWLHLVGIARRAGPSPRQRARRSATANHCPPRSVRRSVLCSLGHVGGWPLFTLCPNAPRPIAQSPNASRAETGTRPGAERVIVYLHGGSYVSEISRFHWRFIADLVRRVPARALVPIYPLAPAATAAEVVPRAAALVHELVEMHAHADVVLLGDSAGGGMALAVAEWLRDRGLPQPARVVLVSPWLDATMSDPRQAEIAPHDPFVAARGRGGSGKEYAGDLDARHFFLSPLFGDLKHLPPLTVFAGTRDILYTDALGLVQRAREAGTTIELYEGREMFHDWLLLPTPEARSARADLVALLSR